MSASGGHRACVADFVNAPHLDRPNLELMETLEEAEAAVAALEAAERARLAKKLGLQLNDKV